MEGIIRRPDGIFNSRPIQMFFQISNWSLVLNVNMLH